MTHNTSEDNKKFKTSRTTPESGQDAREPTKHGKNKSITKWLRLKFSELLPHLYCNYLECALSPGLDQSPYKLLEGIHNPICWMW